jgi:SAM-dependent methyltransferase
VKRFVDIPDEARPYLEAQRGDLWSLRGDREAWDDAYDCSVARDYASIAPHIPAECHAVLDVGSGLGGVDIPIAHAKRAAIYLLDGEEEGHVVRLHAQPFNDMRVARGFLAANGVELGGHFNTSLQLRGDEPGPFDLVISLKAWCFHIPPVAYMDFVVSRLRPGGRLIVDRRRGRPDYARQMADAPLRRVATCMEGDKYERIAYERE